MKRQRRLVGRLRYANLKSRMRRITALVERMRSRLRSYDSDHCSAQKASAAFASCEEGNCASCEDNYYTPNELWYVRHHHPVPDDQKHS